MRAPEPIVIQAFNPYHARYPDRRVVSRSALEFMKRARSSGYRVVVEPDDARPLEYHDQKGVQDLLYDPVILSIATMSVDIAQALFSSWLYDRLKSLNASPPLAGESRVVIEAERSGRLFRYDHAGAPISDERFADILAFMNKRQRDYARTVGQTSPFPDLPFPIHLEHTAKIVG
ncbi:MAG TPA: hypothetical protein VFO67_18175, partial [Gemmatimonadales bacterium]|nr:hypothetical protein [Gemmatimonadales bacterium]